MISKLVEQYMGQGALFKIIGRDIFVYVHVIADQSIKALALCEERIQFLDERTVPFGSLVLFSPMPGYDHVGNMQDVQKVTAFLC
jgi:hypothetical protein